MLKISHEKNEFLYSAQRVVFFEPFVSLISGGGFVLGEIQRIKHQKALEYWSQILAEKICPDQLNLFNEAEVEAKPSAPEPEIEVPAHKRRKKQKRDWVSCWKNFPMKKNCILSRKMNGSANAAAVPWSPWAKRKSAQKCSSSLPRSRSSTSTGNLSSAWNVGSRNILWLRSLRCLTAFCRIPWPQHLP